MITLQYRQEDERVERIREFLQRHSLAFREESDQAQEPRLCDGEKELIGEKPIMEYLEQLSGELDQWYYCSC